MKIYRFKNEENDLEYRYEVPIDNNKTAVHDLLTGKPVYVFENSSDNIITDFTNGLYLLEYEKEYISWSEVYDLLFDDQWVGTADLIPMTLAMLQESSEALNELNWKPWKTTEVNLEAYKEELSDVFIFLMVCAKIAGMNADDLIAQTFVKHNYNKIRKDHDRNKDK